ncbi:glucosyl-3-phosphoglycerate synthase [Nocardiopsis sp. TSRI0078]|uniref:glucosyl-3-phosphoglycerate synthase n=1 Tax=unclassified Nocardiopsis TaxID=2649073 RepID=UPI00093BBADC|nr:glucosyl-3-phosphoglycerate synthase [Nocardiopsis sp. TSRI0078]OKI13066.1 glucosyl-3-phosphoglycerate synthase [Nocardiopsis sp. TSRI0078]
MDNEWFERRTYRSSEWTVEQLVELKRRRGSTVSLVIPARDEAATVGGIVARVRTALQEEAPLLDEIVVMDSDSTDDTGARARAAGAAVHRVGDVRPELGHHRGKGEAMWKSLFVTSGDIIAFMDADLVEWDTHFVSGLLGPLLTEPGVSLVKGFYDRVLDRSGTAGEPRGAGRGPGTGGPDGPGDTDGSGEAASHGGGRVTELVARPTIALRWPQLSGVVQPLSGEWAIRRGLFERLSVPTGYGVELAVLVDTALRYGVDAVAQVDLGRRAHRHQSLRGLGAMATELLAVADRRAGIDHGADSVRIRQFGAGERRGRPLDSTVSIVERPPAAEVGAGDAEVLEGVVGRC